MNRIEDLRSVSENTLHGLVADDSLKFRILQKAAGETKPRSGFSFRTVPALCCVLAALIVAILALNTLQPVPTAGPGEIKVFAAGSAGQENVSAFRDKIDPASVVSVELEGSVPITNPEKCASLAGILADKAEKAFTEIEGENHLILTVSDGTAYTFTVCNPYLIDDADGSCWSCPEFFSSL